MSERHALSIQPDGDRGGSPSPDALHLQQYSAFISDQCARICTDTSVCRPTENCSTGANCPILVCGRALLRQRQERGDLKGSQGSCKAVADEGDASASHFFVAQEVCCIAVYSTQRHRIR